MTSALRLLLATAALATVALGGAARAVACDNNSGYSYGGLGAPPNVYGISAQIAQVNAFDVLNGHIAAWVGVGGPGEGPYGSNEWLQVGYEGFPSITGSDLFYEVAVPRRFPVYREVSADVPVGLYTKVTVLEMRGRPNWWRVWVNHQPVSPPILLPDSHGRLLPTATAESWDGSYNCIAAPYRFRHLSVARAPGGGWQQLASDPIAQ